MSDTQPPRHGTSDAGAPASSDAGLPASLEQAWGLRGRPHRGPRPGLSLERIVAAAVRIADANGLAAVSMSRVATELGTAPMSLYRYLTAKDELVALMVDAAFGPPPSSSAGVRGWRERLSGWAWGMRAGLGQHPWVLQVPISGLPTMPNEVAWFEQGLASLSDTALREAEKASVILLISGYVRNSASIDADIEAAIRRTGLTPDEWMASYAQTLSNLADPVRFPAITSFIAAGVFERADPPEAEFVFGLDRILAGIGDLIGERG
jgi:AcrR family transcriptional regulator